MVIANNGREALEAVKAEPYDLILMDVQMPEMDGFEATALIRKWEHQDGRHTPIIAMTAHAMKGDRERCLDAGMDEYLPKPISSETLYKMIVDLSSDKSENLPESQSKGASQDTWPAIDKKSLLAAFDNDWEFLKEAIEMFISDFPGMLTAIQEAVQSRDATKLRHTAHALKGMVGNFQARQTAQVALTLEEKGRQGDFDGVDETYENLAQKMSNLEKTLTALAKEDTN